MARSSVDLPQPLSPTSATDSPSTTGGRRRAAPGARLAVGRRPMAERLGDVVDHARPRRRGSPVTRAGHRTAMGHGSTSAGGGGRSRRARRHAGQAPVRGATARPGRPPGRELGVARVARGSRSTRAERAAGGGSARGSGGSPGKRARRDRSRRSRASAASAAARRCRDGPVGRSTSAGVADLGQPTAVEHGDAVGDLGGHTEVVGHEDEAACRSRRAGCASSSRICACTVTSRAVVGSSAMTRRRRAGDRHGDHHPLAQSAGQLVGVGPQPPLRLGDADRVEQAERLGRRAGRLGRPGGRPAWSG